MEWSTGAAVDPYALADNMMLSCPSRKIGMDVLRHVTLSCETQRNPNFRIDFRILAQDFSPNHEESVHGTAEGSTNQWPTTLSRRVADESSRAKRMSNTVKV